MSSNQGPRVRHDLPHAIREIENVFIPMRDGKRIAARIWMPDDAPRTPCPAILEYIPYRKRDFMRARDEPIHRYFAGYGYAAVRVDVRGTGDSEGLMSDEYSAEEHADALEIIAWIAAQSWCTGAVGMMGISWGGFNALQVAALRPPALRAVITLCSTDDRYADDAHYMGGCLLNENLQWGAILMTYAALPPDPAIVGERWRELWRERLEQLVAFPERWMRHPARDAFWEHGSVSENYAAIEVPVYAIGGWADAYSNAIPRLLAGLPGPRKGLIGPWAHVFPHDGTPGPAIGFLQEANRWWDQWLRGQDTGIMDEPMYRVWMQESVVPQPQYEERPGRWVAEESWPSPRIRTERRHLRANGLQAQPSEPAELAIQSPQTAGMQSGEWCAFGSEGEMPLDQRPDDGRSLCFDSEPLEQPIEILGAPVVELEVTADQPNALLAARLCEVAPDGTSLRVSYGLLNLGQRHSRAHPEALRPGQVERVRIALNHIAHAFPVGHRVRLALSTAYWPIAWPLAQAATLSLHTAHCWLDLPVRPPRAEDEDLADFAPPEVAPGPSHKSLRPLPFRRTVELDLATNELVYTLSSDGGELGGNALARLEEIETDLGYTLIKRHRISETDPLRAASELLQSVRLQRADWRVRVESRVRLSAGANTLHFTAAIESFEGDNPFVERTWDVEIPRHLF